MAVPRLDPSLSKDRIYEYAEYKMLSAQFGRRETKSHMRPISSTSALGIGLRGRRRAQLTYGMLVALGLAVMGACLAFGAFLQSDTLRLSYQQQDLQLALAGMDQSVSEAAEQNLQAEHRLLADAGKGHGVVYPAQTKYVVLTNIPAVSGRRLVENLYPLSQRLIRIDP